VRGKWAFLFFPGRYKILLLLFVSWSW
jgi:hypothetical protein